MTDKNVPKIRFPGFSDPWEQRKLAEIGTIATGNTPKTDVKAFYSESGTPWITPSDIKDGKVYKPSRYLSPEGIKTARLMPAGSILVTCIASIGKNTLLTEESAFNQQINGLTPSKLSDSYFLFTDSSQWSEKMKRIAAAQTMQIINKSEFSHLETMIPSFPEQQMVGKFFYNVDNLITLHQRKLDDLKSLKSGLLQKMFPKPGSAFPEVRFPEFTDPWEQRKIERYVNERNEKGNDELPILSVSIHSGVSGDQQTGTEAKRNVRRSEDKTKYKKVYPGDIVFNMMRAWQGAIGTSKALGMVSPAYIVARLTNEIDPIFLDYEFQLPMIIESINRRSYGVTDFRKRLYWDSFVKIQISIPNSKEEQLKIGSFFTELDRAITLHQRKLENLKLLKQGLLQQMFV